MKEDRDNLESFFNRHLAKGNFEYNEAQWQKLSDKLDMADVASGTFVPLNNLTVVTKAVGVVVLITLAFLLGWYLRGNQENRLSNDKVTNSSHVQPPTSNSSLFNEQLYIDKDKECTEEEVSEDNSMTAAVLPENFSSEQSSNTSTINTQQKDNENNIQNENKKLENQFGPLSASNTELDKNAGIQNLSNLVYEPTTTLGENTREVDYVLPVWPSLNFHLGKGRIQQLEDNGILSYSGSEPKVKPNLIYALFIAPDFNGSSSQNMFSNFGEAVGISVRQPLSSKFRIGIAAVVSNKVYTAPEGAYTFANTSYYGNPQVPSQTDAQCLTLDIPLEMGYLIHSTDSRNIWLNLGFSNYWMLSEKYEFTYEIYDPSQVQNWEGKLENYHFLSSLNLSLSFTKRISKRFGLLFEPYYKMPLKGIGQGDIDLVNGGINLGLQLN